jgi:hypothetical protein
MTTVSEAIEVMGVVAACHHRTAPRMDDREVVLVTAEIWAELFEVYNLSKDDLVAAVKKRARGAADAPEPAEIIAVAREIRRERAERETTEERRKREAAIDAKAEGRVRSLSEYANRFAIEEKKA